MRKLIMKAENMQKILLQHIGLWIAIKEGKVVTFSKSHRNIYKNLSKLGINGAYVVYSPTEEDKKIEYLFRC